MPGSKSDWNEARILNEENRGAASVLGANNYVALYSASPGEAGGGTRITQVPAVAVPRAAASWTDAATPPQSNAVVIDFGTASADAPDAVAFQTFADAALTQPLRYGTLNAAQPIRAGNRISFPVGSLQFTED